MFRLTLAMSGTELRRTEFGEKRLENIIYFNSSRAINKELKVGVGEYKFILDLNESVSVWP